MDILILAVAAMVIPTPRTTHFARIEATQTESVPAVSYTEETGAVVTVRATETYSMVVSSLR